MGARVEVLGTVAVLVDGDRLAISSRSQRTVLSVLAARPGENVSVDVLVDALWPDDPPRTAVRSLRTYVSRLRQVLGDALVGVAGGYRLDIDEDDLDLLRFERLAAGASTAATPSTALALLEEALELWNGPPFGDLGDLEPLRPVTVRLEERRVAAREGRVAALLSSGRPADAVAAAEELVADHPLREQVWVSLVEALTSTGRPTEALRAYQRAVAVLADAGLEPSSALRRAEDGAFAGESTPPARRVVSQPSSSFIGRTEDRAAIAERITRWPVVTLVGPGGVGKTRLARVVAADVEHRFGAGVRVVQLAGVDDPAQVPAVIAATLELTIGPDGVLGALSAAGDLDVLVVVDNCEHVIAPAADAVHRLTSAGGRLRVLTTSREPLSIDGEQLWPVAPLPIDGPDGAVQLFIDRVTAISPDFSPDEGAHRAIAGIVETLDGLPLAVEMAAAASRLLSLPMLTSRLAAELELPPMTRRDLDERQRTLRGLVDWSLRLVDDEARELFTSMAVFAGPVTAADVAAVSGHPAPFDALCRLADHSLVVVDRGVEETSFGMLRTVRQRALDLADGDIEARRARHAAWILAEVSAADVQLRGPHERRAHDRLEALLADIRAAMAWARHHDLPSATRLAADLYLFAQSRARDEVLAWSAELVEELGDDLAGPSGALVLTAAAQRAVNVGALDRAEALATQALEIGGAHTRPLAAEVLADVLLFAGDAAASIVVAETGLAAAVETGDTHARVAVLANLVLACAYTGDDDGAAAWMRELPDPAAIAPSDVAWIQYLEGERLLDADPEPALAAFRQCIDTADGVGNGYLAALCRVSYASLLSRTRDPVSAREPFAALLAHWRSHGDRTHLLTTLRNLVIALDRMGQHEEAAELLGTVLDDAVIPTYGSERALLDQVRHRLGDRLGPPELERRMHTGRGRTIDEAAMVAQRWLGDARPGRGA